MFTTTTDHARVGWVLDWTGDADGDSVSDVAVVGGDEQTACLVSEPVTGEHDLGHVALATFIAGTGADRLTHLLVPGDLDGDGHADAPLGADDEIHFVPGPLGGAVTMDSGDGRWWYAKGARESFAVIPDMDGDGLNEAAWGMPE